MTTLQKIIHVDDEPDIREIAKMSLEVIGGFTVESCSSGIEVLDKALNFAPDLILMDVMMPGMDGPTAFLELQKNSDTAKIPVIFMTAKVQSHEVDAYLELGGVGVITKPFDPASLSQEIIDIMGSINE